MLFQNSDLYTQFYNGHQMSFGKNRVQYKKRSHWQFHRYERFDVYFYGDNQYQARRIAELAEQLMPEVEEYFGYGIQKRVIFVSYRTLSDFRAGNIGFIPEDENTNVGGVTRIIDNKVLLYYEGENSKLENLIRGGISEIIVNDMLFGGSYRQKVSNSALINLPEWFTEGLTSYLQQDWSYEIENEIRDMFLSGKMNKINHLSGNEARIAGHSFWYFIAVRYGKSVIPNILYLTRANKNSETGFRVVTGQTVKGLSPEWKSFYEQMLSFSLNVKSELSDDEILVKGKTHTKLYNLSSSPNGKYLTYAGNTKGRIRVFLFDKETQKQKTIFLRGHKLEQITDFSFPPTAWHPTSKMVAFIIEEDGKPMMYMYYPETKETRKRSLSFLQKILSFDFSDSGFEIAISGVNDGKSDIYLFNTASAVVKRITADVADDLYPKFVNNSKQILFSSNRNGIERSLDKHDFGLTYDLFLSDLSETGALVRVSETPYTNEFQAVDYRNNRYLSLTDTNGIINKTIVRFDSTIAYIDTAVHYRYYSAQNRITDYGTNIYDFVLSDDKQSSYDIFLHKNRYKIYNQTLTPSSNFDTGKNLTDYKRRFIEAQNEYAKKQALYLRKKEDEKHQTDSLRNHPPKNLPHPDSVLIDVTNYVFEKEKVNNLYYKINPITGDSLVAEQDTFIATRNYMRNFYTNYATQQIDFGFLSNSYQAYTGSAYFFNPGLNIFTKVGIFDLFEDYRLSGGVKIGTSLDVFEYLFSFEDLKRRWDKQYIYHRLTYKKPIDEEDYYSPEVKIYTNELSGVFKYPFSQVSAVRITAGLRHDVGTVLPTDQSTLEYPDGHQFFSNTKIEYIFDNSLSLGLNLYEGVRLKVFSEYYQEVDQEYTNLWVNGFDIRAYKRIHRNFIFASRLAGSAAFGKSKLLYYLGGVDNWYVLSPDVQMFDKSVNINNSESYVYQAVATNMRGFVQNARNGTNFLVMNNELRLPIIRYFANRPLNSEFFNSLQIIGFADIGSAWSGISPYDKKNAYRTETVSRNSVTVIIDKNRSAVLAGYGFGVRSKLFGYFFRLDWAWGVDDYYVMPRIFYFSLNLDF